MSWLQSLSDAVDFLSRAVELDRAISDGRMTPQEQSAAVRDFLLAPPPRSTAARPGPGAATAPAW